MQHERRNVLITHADEALGRRLVKRLGYDASIQRILAVGSGAAPRPFQRFLRTGDGRLQYVAVDLTRHRPVNDLFHSARVRRMEIDAVIHLPSQSNPEFDPRPALAGVPERTTETRLVLQHCLGAGPIRQLIALGSAFVYRLAPGNANRLTEHSELDLDPDLPPETRSWVDCDMLLHGEIHNERLCVALLRTPTIVGSSGLVGMHPGLSNPNAPALRSAGFDPMCALIADKDVVRAIHLALQRRISGVFNVAGRESLPLSVLMRWSGRHALALPGPLLRGLARATQLLGAESPPAAFDGPHLRYGFTLDTREAEHRLGFRPDYRIGLTRGSDGRPQIETAPL